MADQAPMRLAIAGFGWWGRHMTRRLADHPWLAAAAVVEPAAGLHDEIRAAGPAPLPDLDAALGDASIDAVVLTTPNTVHGAQVEACAAAGKPVLCEKPLTLEPESARRAVAACRAAGVQLGVGHERRFEPAMEALKRAVDAGALGALMHAEAAFSHDKLIHTPAGDWRTTKAVCPAAGMTGMGVHLTDLFLWFFGRVDTVQALVSSRSLGWETGDVVTVQLGFRSGMTATMSAVLHTPHFMRMHVFGSEVWMEARNATHPDTPGGVAELVVARSGAEHAVERFDWTDTVVANLENWARAARGLERYRFTDDEMIHNVEILDAIARAAETRETVRL